MGHLGLVRCIARAFCFRHHLQMVGQLPSAPSSRRPRPRPHSLATPGLALMRWLELTTHVNGKLDTQGYSRPTEDKRGREFFRQD